MPYLPAFCSVETEKGAIVILHFHLAWSLFSSGEQRVQEHGLSLRQDWVIPPGGRGGVFRLPQTLNTKGWLERMAAMVFSGRSWTKSSYIIRQVVISNATKVSFLVFFYMFLCVNRKDGVIGSIVGNGSSSTEGAIYYVMKAPKGHVQERTLPYS